MNKTKPKVKRSEEYLIHLEQSLYYRRRCRASYALFKELKKNGLLNVDEPFKSQIEEVIAPDSDMIIERRSTLKKEQDEKKEQNKEQKWIEKFEIFKEYATSSMNIDSDKKKSLSTWLAGQKANYSRGTIKDTYLQRLQTIDEWNTWENAFNARKRIQQRKTDLINNKE